MTIHIDADDVEKLGETLKSIADSLEVIAGGVTGIRKWFPYIVAAAGVLYPSMGKIVDIITAAGAGAG